MGPRAVVFNSLASETRTMGESPASTQSGAAVQHDSPSAPAIEPSWWNLIKQTGLSWWQDNCARMGASLAYYAVFSITPLLVLAVMIVGAVYGTAAAEGRIAEELEGVMGSDAARGVQAMIAAAQKRGGTWTPIISIGAALFGASVAFNELRFALNAIWKVRPKPSAHWLYTVKDRLLTFALVLFAGALFLALMVLTSATQAAWSWIEPYLPFSSTLAGWINYGVTLLVETVLFAMVFRYLPDAKIAWRDVLLGAAVTAVLFGAGNALLGIYFTHHAVGSAYGAAGSLAIFLLWAYYSAQIVYLGAEFTQVYARMYGSAIRPDKHAEELSRVASYANKA